jgi:hypothetical protein
MRGKFRPRTLFGPFKWSKNIAPYSSDDDTLDAVRDRKKALFFTSYSRMTILNGHQNFMALVKAALSRDLAIIIDGTRYPKCRRDPTVYVLHPDQAWRVPALNALTETAFVGDGRWSLSSEAQLSLLLGYTTKQRERWIAWQRQRQSAFSCMDLYTLLAPAQLKSVRRLGMRCFGTADQMQGMTVFFPRDGSVPRPNAHRLVPNGLRLARVGVALPAMQKLFGPFETWKARWMEMHITQGQLRLINDGIKSNIQLLTARGWK